MAFEDPIKRPSNIKTIEFLGKRYQVIEVPILSPDLIEQGDRVLISTESGNRYMVRRSRSRNGSLMIYNQRDNFSTGEVIHDQKQILARLNEPMKIWVVRDEAKQLGGEIKSTNVSVIEIRKGIDDILNSTPDELKGKSLADTLVNKATGRDKK